MTPPDDLGPHRSPDFDLPAVAGLLDAITDPVFAKDARHRWVYANAAFRRLLGGADPIGRDDSEFFPAEQVAVFWAGDDAVIHGGRRLEQEEAVGDGLWALVKKWPVRLPGGAPGLVGLICDVTDYRAKALELEKLRAAAIARSDFLAGMSHELRTPLNGVLGVATLIEREARRGGADRLADYAAILLRSSRQIVGVVEDMFDAARLAAGRLRIDAAPFDLVATVRDPVALLSPLAEDRGLAMTLALPTDEVPRVIGDDRRLRQIVTNLVGNAIKFTDVGSVAVALGAERRGRQVRARVTVSDTGPGIAPNAQALIFEPYAQVGDGPARNGAGLGLALSRAMAVAMGGDIALASTPGEGAVFTLTLELPLA